MKNKQIQILLFSAFVILSCQKEKKEVIDTVDFFNKIDLKIWKSNTDNFIKNNCDESLLNLSKKDSVKQQYITYIEGKIRTVDEHIKFYLQTRENFLRILKKEVQKFPKSINSLIITEEYLGIDNPKASYIIETDNPERSYILYFRSNSFKKMKRLEIARNEYDYTPVKSKETKCINQIQGLPNFIKFETVLVLNDSILNYNLKSVFFGSVIIN